MRDSIAVARSCAHPERPLGEMAIDLNVEHRRDSCELRTFSRNSASATKSVLVANEQFRRTRCIKQMIDRLDGLQRDRSAPRAPEAAWRPGVPLTCTYIGLRLNTLSLVLTIKPLDPILYGRRTCTAEGAGHIPLI